MYKVFINTELSPTISLVPSLFAKSSLSFFGLLHVINNKMIYEKINLNLFKPKKSDSPVTLEFTTRNLLKNNLIYI